MKQLRYQLRLFIKNIEARWGMLPVQKQHKYILAMFVFYVAITIAVFVDICLNSDGGRDVMKIDRIENPTIREAEPRKLSIDSISLLLKKQRL